MLTDHHLNVFSENIYEAFSVEKEPCMKFEPFASDNSSTTWDLNKESMLDQVNWKNEPNFYVFILLLLFFFKIKKSVKILIGKTKNS